MSIITNIFGFLGIPLGWILGWLYQWMGNYFLALFVFTLLIRAATFPLSLISQKAQRARIMLSPRLERLQKKYGNDRQKFQQKQQELMEKEGVSMTAGCLPQLIPMILLLAMISITYTPLTTLTSIDKQAVTAIGIVARPVDKVEKGDSYPELRSMLALDKRETLMRLVLTGHRELDDLRPTLLDWEALQVGDETTGEKVFSDEEAEKYLKNLRAALDKAKVGEKVYTDAEVDKIFDKMNAMRDRDFRLFGIDLLVNPGGSFGLLWLLPILSGLLSLASSALMMMFQRRGTSGEPQPGQGCTTFMTLALMPLFSLFLTFTVPGAVGLYWLFSSFVGIAQTLLLNKIFDPRKIRAEAIAADEERRRQRAEDKKKMAQKPKSEQGAQRQKEWFDED